jgi:hypothetical protein
MFKSSLTYPIGIGDLHAQASVILRRVPEALHDQTLPLEEWELLLRSRPRNFAHPKAWTTCNLLLIDNVAASL